MPQPLENLIAQIQSIAWLDHLWSLGVVVASVLLAALVAALLFRWFGRWARRTESTLDDKVVEWLQRPVRVVLALIILRLTLPLLVLPFGVVEVLAHAALIALIVAVAWLVLRAISMIEEIIKLRWDLSAENNLQARAVHTQMRGFRNIAGFLVVLIGLAFVLMSFATVRQFGVTLLASTGVAGIVIGFAAQRSIAAVIAGIQIAITQPIRVDDVVIVEGEWGRIEEISLTYVVVRIWDLRRLVVPIGYFIEKPFQNWTRTSADLLGTVYLHSDYTVPVDEVRGELGRIVESSDLWDGVHWGLQVTGSSEQTMELRALVSAADSGKAWELRCLIREKLIAFLQERYPESLPRLRASLDSPREAAPGAPPPAANPG
jgi:small-conductance mechanosensitive channel